MSKIIPMEKKKKRPLENEGEGIGRSTNNLDRRVSKSNKLKHGSSSTSSDNVFVDLTISSSDPPTLINLTTEEPTVEIESNRKRKHVNTNGDGVNVKKEETIGGTINNTKASDDNILDVEIVGSKGENALSDFPHSREDCVINPFSSSKEKNNNNNNLFCPKCYCYVCDIPTVECKNWAVHCEAQHEKSNWREARRKEKNMDMLMIATRIYPTEKSPPPKIFTSKLRQYQKRSLSFMIDVEENYMIKSGYLCSGPVDVGKVTVVIALIASKPMPLEQQPSLEDVRNRQVSKEVKPLIPIKATVVYTKQKLCGQWDDEISKNAPNLKVLRPVVGDDGQVIIETVDLFNADVIITSPTTDDAFSTKFHDKYQFHCVVVDQSHELLGKKATSRLAATSTLQTNHRWCINANMMIDDLKYQKKFLCLSDIFPSYDLAKFIRRYMLRSMRKENTNKLPVEQQLMCAECGVQYNLNLFSKNQKRKGSIARCMECIKKCSTKKADGKEKKNKKAPAEISQSLPSLMKTPTLLMTQEHKRRGHQRQQQIIAGDHSSGSRGCGRGVHMTKPAWLMAQERQNGLSRPVAMPSVNLAGPDNNGCDGRSVLGMDRGMHTTKPAWLMAQEGQNDLGSVGILSVNLLIRR